MQEVNAVVELSQLGEVGGSHKFQVVFEAVGDFVPKAKSLIFTLAVGKINTEALQYEELFGRGTHKAP
ncbi:hypothetical protein [Halobacillus sp. BAB-2008]|uniref:hypothetical protein n=1 Tax=Halobacillus sp. BAB-2008 TaxID=1246484 RepID=UPI0002F21234|nr:hypothetical protein [Halobacillus sp. BAB-2008]